MAKDKAYKASLFEYDKELTSAFKKDCEDFLEDFEHLNSLSYTDFAKVWKKRNFTYVYAGQNYALMLKNLCENCFYVVKKYIMFPRSLNTQIGAFYLLYGLYYKQPLKGWVKIRLTMDEYKKTYELIQEMKIRKQFDAVFIFSKMKNDFAFIYVALQRKMGPEHRFIKWLEYYYDDTFISSKTESSISKFYDIIESSELVADLEKTNNDYQQLLRKYSVKHPSLASFSSTIIKDLHDTCKNYKLAVTNDTTEKVEDPSIELVRIKEQAMKNKNATYRGSRKVKTALDVSFKGSSSDSDD